MRHSAGRGNSSPGASVAVERALVETIAARLGDLSPDQLDDLDRGLTLLERVLDRLEGEAAAG